MEVYNHLLIEKKWQDFFERSKIFKTKKDKEKKFYCFESCKSGEKIHTKYF